MENLSREKAESMVNLVERGWKVIELSKEVKLERTQTKFPGCVEKVKCKVKELQVNNIHNKLVLFSPFGEMYVESELVIFESPELLKRRKKSIEILVYNSSKKKILIKKGTLMGLMFLLHYFANNSEEKY